MMQCKFNVSIEHSTIDLVYKTHNVFNKTDCIRDE